MGEVYRTYLPGTYAGDFAVGDLNGDGTPDLAVLVGANGTAQAMVPLHTPLASTVAAIPTATVPPSCEGMGAPGGWRQSCPGWSATPPGSRGSRPPSPWPHWP